MIGLCYIGKIPRDAGQAVLLKMTSFLNTLGTQGQALCHHGLSLINCWTGSMNCKWKHYWCHLHLRIKWSVLPSQQILVCIVYCDWQRHESVNNQSCRDFYISHWEQLYKHLKSTCDFFIIPYLLQIPLKPFWFQWNWPPPPHHPTPPPAHTNQKSERNFLLWILISEIWRGFHRMHIIRIQGTCYKRFIHKKTWLVLD